MGVHNKASGVLALCSDNPNCDRCLRYSRYSNRLCSIVSDDFPSLQAAGLRFTDCSEPFAVVRSTTTGGSSVPDMAHLLGVASLVLGDVSDPDL
jgi:hypothetical protein